MKYLDRTLVVSPYHYGLCLSEKVYHKELKRLNLPRDQWASWINSGANATAHMLDGSDGTKLCLVCLGPHKGATKSQVHAMLVHEAVHIWQYVRESLGEKEPSSEFEAYAVQSLSQRLMESFEKQTRKKR